VWAAVMATDTKIAALAERVRQLPLPDQLRLAARLIEEDRSVLARPIVEHVAIALSLTARQAPQ
jgi:hypothetical protein